MTFCNKTQVHKAFEFDLDPYRNPPLSSDSDIPTTAPLNISKENIISIRTDGDIASYVKVAARLLRERNGAKII